MLQAHLVWSMRNIMEAFQIYSIGHTHGLRSPLCFFLFLGSYWYFSFCYYVMLIYWYLMFWQVSSIIFVDLPVSTGFSYATTRSGTQRSDSRQVLQVHQFLRKVLTIFQFLVLFHNHHLFLWFFVLSVDKVC